MPLPIAAGLAAALTPVLLTLARMWLVSIVGRFLLTLGIGLFAYNYAIPEINDFIASKFHSLPDFVRQSVGAAGLDVFVTMVVSAMAVRATASFFFGRRPSE